MPLVWSFLMVRVVSSGYLMTVKAPTCAVVLGEAIEAVGLARGTMNQCGGDGVRKLGFHLLQQKMQSKTGAIYRAFCSKISYTSRTLYPSHLIRSGVRFCWDSSVGDNLCFLLDSLRFFSTDPMCEKRNPVRWRLGHRAIGASDYKWHGNGGRWQMLADGWGSGAWLDMARTG
jgi:hypothetical protein